MSIFDTMTPFPINSYGVVSVHEPKRSKQSCEKPPLTLVVLRTNFKDPQFADWCRLSVADKVKKFATISQAFYNKHAALNPDHYFLFVMREYSITNKTRRYLTFEQKEQVKAICREFVSLPGNERMIFIPGSIEHLKTFRHSDANNYVKLRNRVKNRSHYDLAGDGYVEGFTQLKTTPRLSHQIWHRTRNSAYVFFGGKTFKRDKKMYSDEISSPSYKPSYFQPGEVTGESICLYTPEHEKITSINIDICFEYSAGSARRHKSDADLHLILSASVELSDAGYAGDNVVHVDAIDPISHVVNPIKDIQPVNVVSINLLNSENFYIEKIESRSRTGPSKCISKLNKIIYLESKLKFYGVSANITAELIDAYVATYNDDNQLLTLYLQYSDHLQGFGKAWELIRLASAFRLLVNSAEEVIQLCEHYMSPHESWEDYEVLRSNFEFKYGKDAEILSKMEELKIPIPPVTVTSRQTRRVSN